MSSDRAAAAAATSRPIPIPFRVRWSLFRSRWLPVFTVALCSVLMLSLWSRVAAVGQAVGEVERVKVVISSVVEGRLDYVNGQQVRLLEHVEEGDVVAQLDDTNLRAQMDAAQAEIKLLQEQLKTATAPGANVEADRVSAMKVALAAKEEHLSQLDGKLEALVIKAPIAGTVTQIHSRAGQFVQAGHPILEIASEHGTSIVAFLRAEQQIVPREGMEVEIRTASDPYHPHAAKVESVAGQFDSVPPRLLRDPKTPEWGIPIRVTLPPEANARPGEIVRILFRSRPGASASSTATASVRTMPVIHNASARHNAKAHADAAD